MLFVKYLPNHHFALTLFKWYNAIELALETFMFNSKNVGTGLEMEFLRQNQNYNSTDIMTKLL